MGTSKASPAEAALRAASITALPTARIFDHGQDDAWISRNWSASLKTKNDSKIVMLVADGLGGLPMEPGGPTELETAKTPNLDRLAKRGVLGSMHPDQAGHHARQRAGPPGAVRLRSGQVRDRPRRPGGHRRGLRRGTQGRGHPLQFLHAGRRRARSRDRRAGRIASEESGPLAIKLRQVKIPGVEVFVEPVKEHRFVVVFRGEGLGRQRGRHRSAEDGRSAAGARGRRRGQPEDGRGRQASSSSQARRCWPARPRPTA